MNLITVLIIMLLIFIAYLFLLKYFSKLDKQKAVKHNVIEWKLDDKHFNQIRTMFQQDDIKDAEINPIKQKHRYVSMEHRKAVKAYNKSHAILMFKEKYNLTVTRKDIK